MSISILPFKQILNYYLKGFFTNVNSVLDMGDHELSVPFDLLSELIKQACLKFDEKIFERAKDFPARPRVPSSSLWKTLGINKSFGILSTTTFRPLTTNLNATFF